MKAKLHPLECDEDELVDMSDTWIPIRPEHNDYATPRRKAYTPYVLGRA